MKEWTGKGLRKVATCKSMQFYFAWVENSFPLQCMHTLIAIHLNPCHSSNLEEHVSEKRSRIINLIFRYLRCSSQPLLRNFHFLSAKKIFYTKSASFSDRACWTLFLHFHLIFGFLLLIFYWVKFNAHSTCNNYRSANVSNFAPMPKCVAL